jgi:hypothetical protein
MLNEQSRLIDRVLVVDADSARDVRAVFDDATPSGSFAAIDVGTPPLSYRKG